MCAIWLNDTIRCDELFWRAIKRWQETSLAKENKNKETTKTVEQREQVQLKFPWRQSRWYQESVGEKELSIGFGPGVEKWRSDMVSVVMMMNLACVEWIQCKQEWPGFGWRNEFGSLFQRLGDECRFSGRRMQAGEQEWWPTRNEGWPESRLYRCVVSNGARSFIFQRE